MSSPVALRAASRLPTCLLRQTRWHIQSQHDLSTGRVPLSTLQGLNNQRRRFKLGTRRVEDMRNDPILSRSKGDEVSDIEQQRRSSKATHVSFLHQDPQVFTAPTLKLPIRHIGTHHKPDQAPFIIILVTPGCAALLDPTTKFIPEKILRPLGFKLEPGTGISVLSAVVDALPQPLALTHIRSNNYDWSETKGDGTEGISLYIQSEKGSARLWEELQPPNTVGQEQQESNHGTLTFVIEGAETEDSTPASSYSLRLPLANTVFQNGETFTLRAQCWEEQPPLSSGNFELVTDKRLPHATVELFSDPSSEPRLPISYLRQNFLTEFRTVHESMGNILRSFSGIGDRSKSLPASQELEVAIPRWLKQFPSQPYELWAHVVPREVWPKAPQLWQSQSEQVVGDLLSLGHRFHRVLSGGGGWGANKGLIALDPDSGFGATGPVSDFADDDHRGLFAQTVRTGDLLRFVAVLARSDESYEREHTLHQQSQQNPTKIPNASRVIRTNPCYAFGTSANRLEQPEGAKSVHEDKLGSEPLPVLGMFGALSQKDASISLDLLGQKTFATLQQRNITKSRLPPYCRFTYIVSSAEKTQSPDFDSE